MSALLGFAAAVAGALILIALMLFPAYSAGRDWSGAVEVEARRQHDGILVRLRRLPLARGLIIHSVGVSREVADELGLGVPEGYRVSVDKRWLTADRDTPLRGSLELHFPATRDVPRQAGGVVRVTTSYRPGIRRIRHGTQVAITAPKRG